MGLECARWCPFEVMFAERADNVGRQREGGARLLREGGLDGGELCENGEVYCML
jgi:hypothetical protein